MAFPAAELALDIKATRFVAGFTAFVERNIVRWRPPAAGILNSEFRRAGEAYERTGSEQAALDVVTEPPWRKYMDRVWLSTVPRAGELVSEQLAKAPPDLFIQAAVRWLRLNGAQHVTWITDTSRGEIGNQIRIGVSKGESRSEIAARITNSRRSITPWRAELIARTEVHAAANYGSLVAAADVRVPMEKIWVARSGARPTHAAASGQRRSLAAAFQVGGYPLEFPGDTSGGAPASEICNCRCVISYAVAERRPARPRRAA